jgi:hypothetical protein
VVAFGDGLRVAADSAEMVDFGDEARMASTKPAAAITNSAVITRNATFVPSAESTLIRISAPDATRKQLT